MRNDNISKVALKDVLICSFAESLLQRQCQIKSVISIEIRELGRPLIMLKQITGAQTLFNIKKPQYFDNSFCYQYHQSIRPRKLYP